MRARTKVGIGAVLLVGLSGGGAAYAMSAGGDDESLSGGARAKASAAALAHTGGGTVTEAEVGDDGAAYGVEVRMADGRRVEVELDEGFHVIGAAADDDGASDQDAPGDD